MPKAKSVMNKRKQRKPHKKTKKVNKKNRKHTGGFDNDNNNNNINNNPEPALDTDEPKFQVSYKYAGVEFITIDKDFEIEKKDLALYEMQNMPYIRLSQDIQQGLARGDKYVLIMYDDNSYVLPEQLNQYKNKTPPFYLHLVVEYSNEYKYGIVKLDYAPLTPPDNTGPHNYIFQLYKLDGDKKLNDNKLSIIEVDKLKRSIHSEEHNHMDYLLVLLGLSTGDKPVDIVKFKVNTNNNQPLPSSNVAPPPVSPVQTPTEQQLPLEAASQGEVKTINLGGEPQPENQVEPDQPNEVNDKVLDVMAENEDKNEVALNAERKEVIDPNEDNDNNDNENEIEQEFANMEKN